MIDAILDFGALDLVDEDGRPCGELASARYDPGATEVIACPYAGVRRGGPMNVTALRQLTAVWPEVVGSAAALAGPDATVFTAFRAAVAGTAAPVVFAERYPDQPVPRVLSALFKTSLGFTQVLSALLLADDGVADAPLAELGDGAQFLAYLDDQRWLLGQVQVCAGSPPMLVEMFRALCGHAEPAVATAVADLGDAWITPTVDLIGVQTAYILALNGVVGRGGSVVGARGEGWRAKPAAPWLRAIAMRPGRTPAHARRLFPAEQIPAAVERLIAAADGDLASIEDVFRDTAR